MGDLSAFHDAVAAAEPKGRIALSGRGC
jgi:hypothetical protein